MSSWLRCSLEPGMLPGEYAIETQTAEGRTVSLFASEDQVKADEGLVRVEVLENGRDAALVRLPSPALEVSSRTVTVPSSAVVKV